MRTLTWTLLLLAAWVLLVWPFFPTGYQDVAAGVLCAIFVALFLRGVYPERAERLFSPRRWFWLLLYIPYFLYYCVKANLDVAYRVLHAKLPIRPGIVKVHTTLKSDLAKTFLANSITLTPGTISVDIVDQDVYVHWIYVATEDPEEETRSIVRPFERMLKEIFE